MQQAKNQINVEGHNETNQLRNISSMDFFRIRDLVIKGQKRMKDKFEKQQVTETWLEIEKAWYDSKGAEVKMNKTNWSRG